MNKRDQTSNHREIIGGNIDRHDVGRNLTPEAREKAINFALDNWNDQMGNGEATEIGIKHVTSDVFKE